MEERENLRTVYKELCSSYRAVDDFRGKLLGFLPLASGTEVFLLIHGPTKSDVPQMAIPPIGAFGMLVMIGLFVFAIYASGPTRSTLLGALHGKSQFEEDASERAAQAARHSLSDCQPDRPCLCGMWGCVVSRGHASQRTSR
jgi:hypothetical protein